MIVISRDQSAVQLVMDIVYGEGSVIGFISTFYDLSDQIGQDFKTVKGYKNLRAFSNEDYDSGKGIVRLYTWNENTGEAIVEWVGDEGSRLGEYVWIGEDTLLQEQFG